MDDERETRCQGETQGSEASDLGKLMEELRMVDLTKQESQTGSQLELDTRFEAEFDPRFEFESETEFDLGWMEDDGGPFF